MNRAARSAARQPVFKDAILDDLARRSNVAQFVSFDASLGVRFIHVKAPPDAVVPDPRSAVVALLKCAVSSSVNVRSYDPLSPQASEFVYGVRSVDAVMAHLKRLSAGGLYTIVNETIDVHDGGVSGVVGGDVVEFAPDDTPRAVEKPGIVAVSKRVGAAMLRIVYGIDLETATDERVEFSVHPKRQGLRSEHVILWETSPLSSPPCAPETTWPNRFSRMIGDKAFGLLYASCRGFAVPRTTVVARRVAPFSFGRPTGSGETWMRTAPAEPQPGRFSTTEGWADPFLVMAREDPDAADVASVLAQEGVRAEFSGAAATGRGGAPVIEGVSGEGDDFMLGRMQPMPLPDPVKVRVTQLLARALRVLGPVRFEWADDGERIWLLQLHKGGVVSSGTTIVPGRATRYQAYDVADGLEGLRGLVATLEGTDVGIVLLGDVGVMSHFGDVLRRSGVPSRLGGSATPLALRNPRVTPYRIRR